jgi:hypothetical protein
MLWFDGFDEIPDTLGAAFLATAGYLATSGTINKALGRGNKGRCAKVNAGGYFTKHVSERDSYCIGFGFKYDGVPGSVSLLNLYRAIDGNYAGAIATLTRNGENGLTISIGGKGYSSTAEVLHQGVWAYVELKVFAEGGQSRITVRVNNVTVINKLTSDVSQSERVMNKVSLACGTAGTAHSFDDFYVLDANGDNNNLLGDCFVENVTLKNNAVPIQWSPVGTTQNYTAVNEVGPADENKYNVASESGMRDMFNVRDLNILTDNIYAVMLGIRARKLGTGAAQIRSVMNDGVDRLGNVISPDADFRSTFDIYSSTPSGAAWSVENFEGLIVGYEVV